ncbi:MAG: hypothetical protein HOI95_12040 [Chromatiales bacterium]|nr:hypothetical protein [Chromatiales bacterium]
MTSGGVSYLLKYKSNKYPFPAGKGATMHDLVVAVGASGARTKPLTATRGGFSLNYAVICEVNERAKLKRVGGA